jgi:hypothetical protein
MLKRQRCVGSVICSGRCIDASLIAEPGRPEDGGDEGILRTFLPASLEPAAHRNKLTN